MEEQFGPYVLREMVGHGGFGQVYRASDTRKNNRSVAIKLLPAATEGDAAFQRRFLREAELAAALDSSRHVVPIHDYGEIDGRPFIVMRLVEGMDMATHLRREGPLTAERAVRLVCQVAVALDAAHAIGLVHRDVKPANILLDRPRDRSLSSPPTSDSDFVYLIDFGISANLMSNRQTSSTVAGTMAYMAPERFAGNGGDQRVDVYALGCVLYEFLSGSPPFTGDSAQLLYAHLSLHPPPVPRTVARVPAALEAVIRTAMEKNPDDRYAEAGELGRAAIAALAGPASQSGSPTGRGPVDHPRQPAPETRDRLGGGSTGGPVDDPGRGVGDRDHRTAVLHGDDRSVVGDHLERRRWWRRGAVLAGAGAALLVLLVLLALVVVVPSDSTSEDRPDAPAAQALPVTVGDSRGVAFSRDGRQALVAKSDQASVTFVDTTSGEESSTLQVGAWPEGMIFSPDGRRAYVANQGTQTRPSNTVSVIDTEARTVRATITVGPVPYGLAVSPDGRTLYVTNRGIEAAPDRSMSVIDTATDTVTATVEVGSRPGVPAISPDGARVYVPCMDVATQAGAVSVLDDGGRTVAPSLPAGGLYPESVAIAPTGTLLFVATLGTEGAAGSIQAVDVNARSTRPVARGAIDGPRDLALTPDGRTLVATNSGTDERPGRSVALVDPATGAVRRVVDVGGRTYKLGVRPDGREAWVTTLTPGGVWRVALG